MPRYENIIAYDGAYEDDKFVPLDEMPPHKERHRAVLLLISEASRTREHSMWKAYLGDEDGNPCDLFRIWIKRKQRAFRAIAIHHVNDSESF